MTLASLPSGATIAEVEAKITSINGAVIPNFAYPIMCTDAFGVGQTFLYYKNGALTAYESTSTFSNVRGHGMILLPTI